MTESTDESIDETACEGSVLIFIDFTAGFNVLYIFKIVLYIFRILIM